MRNSRSRTVSNRTIIVEPTGEPIIRPQSEFKASTPVDKPPPAPMSAPPELAEPAKLEGKFRMY